MDILVISGPTASGKSRLALELAQKFNTAIINADSLQVYKGISVITASPTEKDLVRAPHYLYNYISVFDKSFSVGPYLEELVKFVTLLQGKYQFLTIIGGTGMYISAILNGIHSIPSVIPETQKIVNQLYRQLGKELFYQKLIELDPLIAQHINPNDYQRMVRAYAVFAQTGQSILEYYKEDKRIIPFSNYSIKHISLIPERKLLHHNCHLRLNHIFENGALEEVKFLRHNLSETAASVQKAIGVQQILAFLENKITLEEAKQQTGTKTRQYAKRQLTWIRNQFPQSIKLQYDNEKEFIKIIDSFSLSLFN